jgi:hypothetical protein
MNAPVVCWTCGQNYDSFCHEWACPHVRHRMLDEAHPLLTCDCPLCQAPEPVIVIVDRGNPPVV